MSEYPEAMAHGDIEEVFPDIFVVTGTSRPIFMEQQWQFSRNMTIVRDGDTLTLVNTVRLNDAGLSKLEALGKVQGVVKLGSYHGYDDPFYLDRYQAPLWALEGMEHESGRSTNKVLTVGGEMPFSKCSLFSFETAAKPEGILVLDREGGILLSCDSVQNWVAPDRFFDEPSATKMRELGFFRTANLGPGWLKASEPKPSDFVRLKALSFRHLLSAHGVPLKDEAHTKLSATLESLFGI